MKVKLEDVKHTALVVVGVEGTCLYIDGYRVAGPKPWGGGKTLHSFTFTSADLKEAEKTRRMHARAPLTGSEESLRAGRNEVSRLTTQRDALAVKMSRRRRASRS